jgi:hypothetical protein
LTNVPFQATPMNICELFDVLWPVKLKKKMSALSGVIWLPAVLE